MGRKILKSEFDKSEFEEFSHRVEEETNLLKEWCKLGILNNDIKEGGFELEVWLLDKHLKLAHDNLSFVKNFNKDFLITEAADSSIEMNIPYDTLHNHMLSRHHKKMMNLLIQCSDYAEKHNEYLVIIGTLPTGNLEDFSKAHLTHENRYYAIEKRLMNLRNFHTLYVYVHGDQTLSIPVSFCLVGAISSFQIHFRIGMNDSARLYNAATALSAPMLALSANSPFMFRKSLWEESRIPFYEQLLLTEQERNKLPRVTFGTGYLKNSLLELIIENYTRYSPLLPQLTESSPEEMKHLQLHNGNIYRWNRPVVDFDKFSRPHFRVEHRPISAGPTLIDMLANAAFYFGITYYYTKSKNPIEEQLPFEIAKFNFYEAARYGLHSELTWCHGKKIESSKLILKYLLPQAKEGLKMLDIDGSDIDCYLSIIEERVCKNKTGSQWQKEYLKRNNQNFIEMLHAYLELQRTGKPVHDWPLS